MLIAESCNLATLKRVGSESNTKMEHQFVILNHCLQYYVFKYTWYKLLLFIIIILYADCKISVRADTVDPQSQKSALVARK